MKKKNCECMTASRIRIILCFFCLLALPLACVAQGMKYIDFSFNIPKPKSETQPSPKPIPKPMHVTPVHVETISNRFEVVNFSNANKLFDIIYDEKKPITVRGQAAYELGIRDLNQTAKDENYFNRAIEYLKKAVDFGHEDAIALLGVCYQKMDSTQKAVECYEKAAEKGRASAFLRLGLCYYTGTCVDGQDYAKAFEYFEKAVNAKNTKQQEKSDANFMLGLCYFLGNGTPQDLEKAKAFINFSAYNNNEAKKFKDKYAFTLEGVEQFLNDMKNKQENDDHPGSEVEAGNTISPTLVITDGCKDESVKLAIEGNVNALLKCFNEACKQNLDSVPLENVEISDEARHDIELLWKNGKFECTAGVMERILLNIRKGYHEVRGIKLTVHPSTKESDKKDEAQTSQESQSLEKIAEAEEAVICFNHEGRIESFNFCMEKWTKNDSIEGMKSGKLVNEISRIHVIKSFIDQLYTAYCKKDTAFINQVFSDQALIITGVVKYKLVNAGPEKKPLKMPVVEYERQTKKEYLDKLANIMFKQNKLIKAEYTDFDFREHNALPVYGVTVRQQWKTIGRQGAYTDEGWVFMIWDFRNEEQPQILVRTWDPCFYDEEKKQPRDIGEIPGLSDYEIY